MFMHILRRWVTVAALALALSSCQGGSDSSPAGATIHSYAAPAVGTEGAVNTFWLETDHGVIVIDALRTIPDAQAALGELQKLGKPIEAIILTHPHPDHCGGIGIFAQSQPGIPIYASSGTDYEIAYDTQGLFALARSFEGSNYPAAVSRPTQIVHDGEELTIDGVRLVVHELGPSEAFDAIAIELPALNAFFEGDVVANEMAVALFEGRLDAWVAQLERVRAQLPAQATIYPGHGLPGPAADLVDAQKHYLEVFRQLVLDNRLPDKTVDDAGKARIIDALNRAFPNYPFVAAKFPKMLEVNIDAVAKELASF
jgi:glyoxylase-like metal-dependent hydrolase (beta-lactamase superfamily II)